MTITVNGLPLFLELLTGIVRSKTITTLNNNINFVSFCDGIAIVRTYKLVFP